ncbi:MAG: PTS system mannose/fructose/N-acetylgalactosamine-transporter subunit IIB [Candidatus Limnocylindrales bacterium]
MSLRLVRIDDRLIHGQVVAGWLRALGADRIVIVDDATARDEFLREVLILAAPSGVPVEVLDLAGGAVRCIELAASPEPVIVLARSPRTVLTLRQAGVPIEVVDLGGLGAGPGRRRLHRTISVSTDELADLHELEQLGTRVEIRIVADDRPIALKSLDSAT